MSLSLDSNSVTDSGVSVLTLFVPQYDQMSVRDVSPSSLRLLSVLMGVFHVEEV